MFRSPSATLNASRRCRYLGVSKRKAKDLGKFNAPRVMAHQGIANAGVWTLVDKKMVGKFIQLQDTMDATAKEYKEWTWSYKYFYDGITLAKGFITSAPVKFNKVQCPQVE